MTAVSLPAPKKTTRTPNAALDKARRAALAEVQARVEALEAAGAQQASHTADAAAGPGPGPDSPVEAAAGTPAHRRPVVGTGGKRTGAPRPASPPAKAKRRPASPAATPVPERPKRLGCLDAAAHVLAESAKPMKAAELIEAMAARGLWKSPGGRTPAATLYAAIIREIAAKGRSARFRKVERGVFEASAAGRDA